MEDNPRYIKEGEWCPIEDGVPEPWIMVYVRLANGTTGADMVRVADGVARFSVHKGNKAALITAWSPVSRETRVCQWDELNS